MNHRSRTMSSGNADIQLSHLRTVRTALVMAVCLVALVASGCGGSDHAESSAASAADATSESSGGEITESNYEARSEALGLSVQTLKRINDESGLDPYDLGLCDTDLYPYDASDGSERDDYAYYLHCVSEIPKWKAACVVKDNPDIASDYEKDTGLDVCDVLSEARFCRKSPGDCGADPVKSYQWVPDKKLGL